MAVFLNEKCTPAALPEICAPRHKLLEKIQKAATGRFIYIGAPAGSGKTVTALLWNAVVGQEPATERAIAGEGSPPVRQTLWIALDAYDNIPSVFYKLFASVICSTQPDNERITAILDDPAFSSSPVEHTVRLLAELQQSDALYTLTLDDFHLITNTEILKSLTLVMKRLPRSFTILFLSRNEPPQEFRGLFRDDNTALINADDLRFSESELRQYYKSLGWGLSDEEAGFVLMASGGLAINVNAVAKRRQIEPGKTEYIFDQYLRQYLWEAWDEGLRDFMLKASVVDEMSVRLAAALTGRQDARELLNELCTNNTFVTHAGEDQYRYHHLFLAFLRNTAKELAMDLSAQNKIAALYYLETKQYLTARRYALQSGDEEIILQAIYQFQQNTNPSMDEYVAFSKAFNREALPEAICRRYPFLYSAQMYAAWLSGDAAASEYYLDKLWQHLPTIAERYPQILESITLTLTLDYRKTFTQLMTGFAAMPPITYQNKNQQGVSISAHMPFAHRSNRDYSEISDEGVIEQLDHSFGLLLRENYAVVRPCLLSGLSLEKNRIEQALAYALEAKAAAADIQNPEMVFFAHCHLASAYLAAGNEKLRDETLAETEQYINRSGAQYLEHNFLALKAKIRLMDADKKAAQDWLDHYFVTGEVPVSLNKSFQYFTTARAYMVLNKGNKAMSVIQGLIQFAQDYRRPLALAEAKTLNACLDWAFGKRTEAAACLEEALADMQGRGFIRPIADEGAAVIPVLKRIAATVSAECYSGRLDRSYVMEVLLAAHEVSKRHKGITAVFKKTGKTVKLSKQQIKMLKLLAQGYKNADIVRITGLALPTVKKHLMLAYEKLGVHDAMDAILKAREMGILQANEK